MLDKTSKRTKAFISYSHQDADWLKRLRVHLKPLEREYDIDIWDDTKITPGSRWKKEIEQAIQSAKVAVLLVSADFLASDFIAADELPPLLKAAEEGGATILPLILGHSRFLKIKNLSQFQAVNNPLQPLDSLPKSEQERILVEVSNSIEAALSTSLQVPNVLDPSISVDHRRTAVNSSEGDAYYYWQLAYELSSQDRFEEAEAAYRKAIELNPAEGLFYNGLGLHLYLQNRNEEAEALYRQAIKLDPGQSGYHDNLGNSLFSQDRFDEAEAAYKQALSLDPNNLKARQNLLQTLKRKR
jgi:tetratricopeptide (TPR) repeat protein